MTDPATAQALREKAQRALEAARRNLGAGDAEVATNRAYYAAFHIASAALALAGEFPKTHAGVHRRFFARFVEGGPLDPETGHTLPFAFGLRRKADYEAFAVFDLAAAADLVRDVAAFVAAVEAALATGPPPPAP